MTSIPSPIPSDIADACARVGNRLGVFQDRLTWYEHAGSTNDLAQVMAERGVPEGTVVAAHAQSAGRGRHGRSWASPSGAGLYVSAVLRPPAQAVPLLTIAAGVAIAEGIQAASGLRVGVKWPNDVYVGGRKLAGILAEAGSSGGGIDHVVVGFGINVLAAAYPADVTLRATSIESELGRAADRGLVLAECLAALAAQYLMLRRGDTASVVEAWRTRAASHLGRLVEWQADGQAHRGTAHDIDASGALIVRDGAVDVRIISGEVRWL